MVKVMNKKVMIKQIKIDKLFGHLDYDICINEDNLVSILTGPNGCGKTTIFKLLCFMFNPSLDSLAEISYIPFEKFSCCLTNNCEMSLSKIFIPTDSDNQENCKDKIVKIDGKFFTSGKYNYQINHEDPIIIDLFDIVKKIRDESQISLSAFFDSIREEGFFSERRALIDMERTVFKSIKDRIEENQCKLNVDFIVANRLQKSYFVDTESIGDGVANEYQSGRLSRRSRYRDQEKVDYLSVASSKMANDINSWLVSYNIKLEEAKRKLPLMYVNAEESKKDSYEKFKERWDKYHCELKKFCDLGILDSKVAEAIIKPTQLKKAYKEKRAFLSIYLDAFEKTLEPLQDNYEKVKLFSDIFNKRNQISGKEIRFTPKGIKIYSYGEEIDLNYLSSGEKHDFIMFYRLIFNNYSNGVVLIDEPEISLHIEWQEDFLNHLIDICRINNLQAIIATHSPNIVNDHLDLFVEQR